MTLCIAVFTRTVPGSGQVEVVYEGRPYPRVNTKVFWDVSSSVKFWASSVLILDEKQVLVRRAPNSVGYIAINKSLSFHLSCLV